MSLEIGDPEHPQTKSISLALAIELTMLEVQQACCGFFVCFLFFLRLAIGERNVTRPLRCTVQAMANIPTKYNIDPEGFRVNYLYNEKTDIFLKHCESQLRKLYVCSTSRLLIINRLVTTILLDSFCRYVLASRNRHSRTKNFLVSFEDWRLFLQTYSNGPFFR